MRRQKLRAATYRRYLNNVEWLERHGITRQHAYLIAARRLGWADDPGTLWAKAFVYVSMATFKRMAETIWSPIRASQVVCDDPALHNAADMEQLGRMVARGLASGLRSCGTY
jgi:hypothetical protein